MRTPLNGLVIEGTDHTGKTTLAKAVAELMSWDYHHMTKPEKPAPDVYLHQLVGGNVLDRFHLGAAVYGHHLGLHPFFDSFIAFRSVQWAILERDYRTVILYYSDDQELKENLEANPKDEMFDTYTIVEANKLYRRIVRTNMSLSFNSALGEQCHCAWDLSTLGWPNAEQIIKLAESTW